MFLNSKISLRIKVKQHEDRIKLLGKWIILKRSPHIKEAAAEFLTFYNFLKVW